MHRHTTLDPLPAAHRGAAVAMGNFDGVHLGHQSVLALARAAAVERDAPFGTITFEPHPRSFFQPDAPAFRLMNADSRAHRLAKLGVEELYELPFDGALAGLTAEAFMEDILSGVLGIRHLVVGADFRFGKGRTGDVALLQDKGPALGFGVTAAPLVSDARGDYSSTAIRTALSEGRPADAARMLGHWHRIEGRVEKGFQRGRDLGFPTANIALDGLHLPKFGVYAVLVDVLDGPNAGRYRGAASIGIRPTFGDHKPNLEVFLLDFAGDLYGADLSVALVAYERPEEKFDTLDALIEQMNADVDACRASLDAAGA
ncbi:bifunctional riboflavin kinase/FAD synthetase [Oceanomicrobium pacificus]|uniref:Riboflavin biosynthesis protein n=1 Tax=Oceanomicrobium pacificus TaxID=2692916 RepID=A0A6B0TK57_9RHOB|nr:bifunctional riboflavin kinase/FAD synthetase [Oceanomicrobium pacificus]MXU64236.1 bifunctional riboflavin kinase/FAD synthetase [Oceanomicrobium pacificus]